ncbi:MAG: putative cytosolic protein [uncultured bacterium]|nr:MAG: putative cytosolic protein [uncultured bacterium]
MFKFPLIKGKQVCYPRNPSVCPICKKKAKSNVILNTGALLADRKNNTAVMSEDLDGFFSIILHDHPKDNHAFLHVADSVHNGQCEFYFCSTKCLRKFFNICVDEFEKKIRLNDKALSATINKIDYTKVHKHSSQHRAEISKSFKCGCYYCLAIFEPEIIKEWIDTNTTGIGQTAVCPKCGIDSVIGSKSGYPIIEKFLKKMYNQWFKKCISAEKLKEKYLKKHSKS